MNIQSGQTTRDMLGRGAILPLDQALGVIETMPLAPVETEEVSLDKALGRVLGRQISAPEDLPTHPRSTMDGYAVRGEDTFGATESMPVYLEVSGEVLMGEFPTHGPAPGACHRIATGGFLPPGTDAVVMLEHTVVVDRSLIEVVRPVANGANCIGAGEEVSRDQPIIPPGHCLRPQDLGLLAGMGMTRVEVRRRVRVGVISTGDEIVAPDIRPPSGKIRDMNGVQLSAMVVALGGEAVSYGIVRDREDALRAEMTRALLENDLVLLSGSSSVGCRDLGERVIASLGAPGILVHGVAIKPGKPVIIGQIGEKPVFGLPGHPVSAAVAFDLFVRPTINRLSGLVALPFPVRRTVKALLMRNINSAPGRTDFVRVRVEVADGDDTCMAYPVLGKSGALSTMVRAHGYLVVEASLQGLAAGTGVEVCLF